jgi:hypothetical protein
MARLPLNPLEAEASEYSARGTHDIAAACNLEVGSPEATRSVSKFQQLSSVGGWVTEASGGICQALSAKSNVVEKLEIPVRPQLAIRW